MPNIDNASLGEVFLLNKGGGEPEEPSEQHEVTRETIHLGADLEFLIRSTAIQIDTPKRLPAPVLQAYIDGNKQLPLLTRDKKVYSATLTGVTDKHLIVNMESQEVQKLLHRLNGPLLAVFADCHGQNFILQGKLSKASAGGIQLAYQDPRHDKRFLVKLAEPASLCEISPAKSRELLAGTLVPIRETAWITNEEHGQIVAIDDVLKRPEADLTLRAKDYIQEDGPALAAVHDLSLGGAQLVLDEPLYDQDDRRVLQLKIELPSLGTSEQGITLNVLTLVRAIRSVESKIHLHCRFLCRLPECCVNVFARLVP